MKKLIAILTIAIVLVCAVFATEPDGKSKLVLSSKVAKVAPNFTLYLGDEAGTAAGVTVEIDEDISEDVVNKTFYIKQTGTAAKPYAKYSGTVTLTVTIEGFTHTFASGENAGTYTTTEFEIKTAAKGAGYTVGEGNSAKTYLAIGNGANGEATSAISEDGHSAIFKLTYSGKKVTDTQANTGDNKIAKIIAEWQPDDTLPMEGEGTAYTANVVLEYTYGN